jgi:hypothetical protein
VAHLRRRPPQVCRQTRAKTATLNYAVNALGIRIERPRIVVDLLPDELRRANSVQQIQDLPVVLRDEHLAYLVTVAALRMIRLVAVW